MHNLSGFFNIIILLGAIQGFIISSLLFFSKENRLSNRLLGVFIFLIALATFNCYLIDQNWYTSNHFFQLFSAVFPTVVIMPLGPLLLFYTRASLNPDFKLSKRDKFQFFPVIIDLFPYLTAIFFIIAILSGLIKHHQFNVGNFIDTYNVYSDIPRWVSLTFYMVLCRRYITNTTKELTPQLSYQLNWLKQCISMLMAFQVLWLLYLIPYVIPAYTDKLLGSVDWYPIYVPLAILIYWLGIKGYLVMKYQYIRIKTPPGVSTKLSQDILNQTIRALKNAMETDTIYLDPSLNLAMLSKYTGIPQKTISAVINQHLHKSFNEFVNEYRVEAFKVKVKQLKMDNLTFAGIASECGFNSQATFQRTFKQVTGLSPSEFKNQALQIG